MATQPLLDDPSMNGGTTPTDKAAEDAGPAPYCAARIIFVVKAAVAMQLATWLALQAT